MKSKKAQSEIITTVLIILLVLAAIVIVWQVVQNTLKNTSTTIDVSSACIGVQTSIVSAKSATSIGNCTVTTKLNKADCLANLPAAGGWTSATDGEVIVQRSSQVADSKYIVTAKVYVDGQDVSVESNPLSVMGTEKLYVPASKLLDNTKKVKAVTFIKLASNPTVTGSCGESTEVVAN